MQWMRMGKGQVAEMCLLKEKYLYLLGEGSIPRKCLFYGSWHSIPLLWILAICGFFSSVVPHWLDGHEGRNK